MKFYQFKISVYQICERCFCEEVTIGPKKAKNINLRIYKNKYNYLNTRLIIFFDLR